MRSSLYSSQSSAAQSIDIDTIATSSDDGQEAMGERSVDGEDLDVNLKKELGMSYTSYTQCFIFF